MSINLLKKTSSALFLVCSLGTAMSAYAWFFHYNTPPNMPSQEPDVIVKEAPEILATMVLIDIEEQKNSGNCIELLKAALQEKFKNVNILVTHTAHMHETKLEIPKITNKPHVDIALSLRIVCCQQQKPSVHIYRYSGGQEFISQINEMAFYSLENAYLFCKDSTQSWAALATRRLTEKGADLFDLKGPYACPFGPLVGVNKPALGFELCVANISQASLFVEPLVEIIEIMIDPLIKKRKRTAEL